MFFTYEGFPGFYIAQTTHRNHAIIFTLFKNSGLVFVFNDFRDFSGKILSRKEANISRKEKRVFRKKTLVSREELLYLVRNTCI